MKFGDGSLLLIKKRLSYLSLSRDMYLSATLRIFSCMWLNLINNRWRCCSSSSSLSLLRSRCDMMSKNSANIFSKMYRTQRQTSKWYEWYQIPADIYLLRVNNRNNRIMCQIGSMLTMKTPEWFQLWHQKDSSLIVNFEKILHIVLVFPLLNLS